MNRMPPAVEMDVVVGPKAEGAPEGDRSLRAHDHVSRDDNRHAPSLL